LSAIFGYCLGAILAAVLDAVWGYFGVV